MSDHGGVAVSADETFTEDEGEFGLAVVDLVFVGIECAYAFLECEQTFVDFSTIKFGLLAHVDDI